MIKKIAVFAVLLFSPCVAFATSEAVKFLSEDEVASHSETIKKAENYLSNLTTITSEFTQVAPDGNIAGGKFYLERPQKMRWEYKPPVPILMVANGSELVYYDSELQQVSYIPLTSNLIGFLAQEKISFSGDVGIISFSEEAGFIRIGVAQREKPSDGNLLLEFSDNPLLIRSMVVTDASGQVTNVALNNAKFGDSIDKKLFDFRDPRKKKGQ